MPEFKIVGNHSIPYVKCTLIFICAMPELQDCCRISTQCLLHTCLIQKTKKHKMHAINNYGSYFCQHKTVMSGFIFCPVYSKKIFFFGVLRNLVFQFTKTKCIARFLVCVLIVHLMAFYLSNHLVILVTPNPNSYRGIFMLMASPGFVQFFINIFF